jgi:hypothetical protein
VGLRWNVEHNVRIPIAHTRLVEYEEFSIETICELYYRLKDSSVKAEIEEGALPKTNLTAAVPAERIHQDLAALGFCQRNIHALSTQTEFQTIPFRLHQ